MMQDAQPLLGDYTLRMLDDADFDAVFREYHPRVFAGTWSFDVGQALSAEERAAVDLLRQRVGERYRLNLGIYHHERCVGWSFGIQDGPERFYMINTGILPEHQNRGIYTALLPNVLERVRAEGFQIVYSRHTATNNRILVLKLKAGFVITGIEISDQFGLLVHLSYFFNPLRRRVLDVRVGEVAPDEEIRGLLRGT
jgi:RimJ/RimL family protein N-acetyltransferase